jgi:hypothetical protein
VASARTPSLVTTSWRRDPATTWALVTTRPFWTGKPLPNSTPPQPRLWIWTVALAARSTSGFLAAWGGGPETTGGRRVLNASGNPERSSRPRSWARAAGGRGA